MPTALKNNKSLDNKDYFRYHLILEYLGIKYYGSQVQNNYPTIYRSFVNSCLKSFPDKFINFTMASRTDKGVHAVAHSCHLDLSKNIEEYTIMMAINYHLKENKEDIAIIKVKLVDSNFHVRYNAKYKIYQYKIINRKAPLILDKNYALHIPYELDLNNMIKASKYLIGEHDFTSFRGKSCTAKNPIKNIKDITIIKKDDMIDFYLKANSFLQYMVRNIVGTLLLFGKKKENIYLNPNYMKFILSSKDRREAGEKVKPHGLYLYKIIYNTISIN